MNTYLALLRGINVSGQKLIKMAELRDHLKEIGFKDVETYIQSGNIVFKSDVNNPIALSEEIADKILQEYGFDVPVLVKTREEFETVFSGNPYLTSRNEDVKYLHVTLLEEEFAGDANTLFLPFTTKNEEYSACKKEIYLFFPDGYGKTKLTNNLIEKKLGVRATTRNWKTITKLMEMLTDK